MARIGIVGGLGPIASAEFLRTIYEYSAGKAEQRMPAVILWSDPTVPDRTHALLNGAEGVLLDQLRTACVHLCSMGCSCIVICCVTMHALVPQLPLDLQRRVLSLVDVTIDRVLARRERQLLWCSSGTRTMGLFERHPRWPQVEPLMIRPRREDQAIVHELIYAIKRSGDAHRHIPTATGMLDTYGVQSMAVGCTELHLLAKAARRQAVPWRTCDPLDWIARTWPAVRRRGRGRRAPRATRGKPSTSYA